ncbi:MAG: GntR family transcriptional regulator [Vallitaleaceae bacterium]|nr:GntR family transcriptional regulator [Vallitaleaceae bacterium]
MFLEINLESEIPIYTQIRNEIIKGIALGQLVEGDGLPSVRQMAIDMGINMHTINKGYNFLKQEGFLSIHRRKGVVVNGPDKYRYNAAFLEILTENLSPIIIEAYTRGVRTDTIERVIKKILLSVSVPVEGGDHD